jgi:hypothetical protein
LLALSLVLGIPLRAAGEDSDDWSFTTIDFPEAMSTLALDIDAAGNIVGRYVSAIDGNTHGFLRTKQRQFVTIDFPGAIFSVAAGINARGEIVGRYRLRTDPTRERHGFLVINEDASPLSCDFFIHDTSPV